ncbi:MAG: hypothetical protein HC925_03335 [Coleofasciculaceae cyanobacterium SM2_3_26]|nr:hypothetical protein [Coleofasciculaceae cyanobacterium SM2_3_26]
MAYSDFTLAQVRETFALAVEENRRLFTEIKQVQPSERLLIDLNENKPLAIAINSEKARSEFLIAPILAEVRRQTHYQTSLFSGVEFTVDAALGLKGFCDYILSRSKEQYYITAPVAIIVEAKNENIIAGLGQCIAVMVAAQLFNQRAGHEISTIYGAVTTGTNWKFITLCNHLLNIDVDEYYINQIEMILGIFLQALQIENQEVSV